MLFLFCLVLFSFTVSSSSPTGIAKYRHLKRVYGSDENERERMASLEAAAELLKERKIADQQSQETK